MKRIADKVAVATVLSVTSPTVEICIIDAKEGRYLPKQIYRGLSKDFNAFSQSYKYERAKICKLIPDDNELIIIVDTEKDEF